MSYLYNCLSNREQDVIKGLIDLHREANVLGLKYLQAGANKRALDTLVDQHDAEFSKARQDFEKGMNDFKSIATPGLVVKRKCAHLTNVRGISERNIYRSQGYCEGEVDGVKSQVRAY